MLLQFLMMEIMAFINIREMQMEVVLQSTNYLNALQKMVPPVAELELEKLNIGMNSTWK